MPHLCGFYPGICLTTEEKARKNLSQLWNRYLCMSVYGPKMLTCGLHVVCGHAVGSSWIVLWRKKQTIHKTNQRLGRVRAMPHLCGFYPGICLTTEEKAQKNFSQLWNRYLCMSVYGPKKLTCGLHVVCGHAVGSSWIVLWRTVWSFLS